MNITAQNREAIQLENTGIGHSKGTIPDTLDAMAVTVTNHLTAIHVPKADILDFSLGGMIAQMIATDDRNRLSSGGQ